MSSSDSVVSKLTVPVAIDESVGDEKLDDLQKLERCKRVMVVLEKDANDFKIQKQVIQHAGELALLLALGKPGQPSIFDQARRFLSLYKSMHPQVQGMINQQKVVDAHELLEESNFPLQSIKELITSLSDLCEFTEERMQAEPNTDNYSMSGSMVERFDTLGLSEQKKKKPNLLDWSRKRAPQSSNNGVPGMISAHQTPTSSNAPNHSGQHGHGQPIGFLRPNENHSGPSSHGQQTGNGQATGFFGANGNQTQSSGFAGAGDNQTPSNNGGHGQGQAMGPPGAHGNQAFGSSNTGQFDFSTPRRAEQGAPLSTAPSSGHQNPFNPTPVVSTRVYTNFLFVCLISHFSVFIAVCFWWRRTKHPPQLFELSQWWR